MKKIYVSLLGSLALSLLFVSCEKESPTDISSIDESVPRIDESFPMAAKKGGLTSVSSCGTVITSDAIVVAALTSVGTDCITFGADGIQLDLDGWTVTNTAAGVFGTPTGPQGAGRGIHTNGHSNILVKGPGTIVNYNVGVHVDGGINVKVKDLKVTGKPSPGCGINPRPLAAGIRVTNVSCAHGQLNTIANISGNEVENQTNGIEIFDSSCVNVGNNSSHDNNSDPFQCHGILLVNSTHNNIGRNNLTRNGECLGIDCGLTLSGSNNNTLVKNVTDNNYADGISIRNGSANNQIVNNQSFGNQSTCASGSGAPIACVNAFGPFFDLAQRNAGPGNKFVNNKFTTKNF